MDDPLRLHSPQEFEFFLEVVPCARCGRGPLKVIASRSGAKSPSSSPKALRTRCQNCKAQRTFHVERVDASPEEPSEVVDLAQWVGLYFQYADRMDKASAPADARDAATHAATCLAEALRFYGDDEMPPESAFRAEPSRTAFRSNPATFARTHLRDLKAMLPVAEASGAAAASDPPVGSSNVAGKESNNHRKSWWKLWR